jgi:hypothetical protein
MARLTGPRPRARDARRRGRYQTHTLVRASWGVFAAGPGVNHRHRLVAATLTAARTETVQLAGKTKRIVVLGHRLACSIVIRMRSPCGWARCSGRGDRAIDGPRRERQGLTCSMAPTVATRSAMAVQVEPPSPATPLQRVAATDTKSNPGGSFTEKAHRRKEEADWRLPK